MKMRLSGSGLGLSCGIALALLPLACAGQKGQTQKDNRSGYDKAARATVLRDAVLYSGPDEASQRVAEIEPGYEVVVVEHNGPWMKVFALNEPLDQDPDTAPEFAPDNTDKAVSGWIKDKGVVSPATRDGDAVLYGAGANFEDQAAQPHAPKDAAMEAKLLYRRVFQYFPDSPLAKSAEFRAADIQWQLEKAENATLPSAKEQEAYLRPQLYEGPLKRVMKRYPGSQEAALAAFDLLDNKLCGDWQGLPKCPEMEAQLYLRYAGNYPESPRAAEAEYDAAYREGVLVTMYRVDGEDKRAAQEAKDTQALADDMRQRFPKSDYTYRAESVAYRVSQGIDVYGSDRE